MLFRSEFLEGIRNGDVTLAFRRWRRPSVQAGGTLLTPVGQLSIQSVDQVAPEQISLAEANRAGYKSREVLLDELRARTEGEVYRVELGPLRPDPRSALRKTEVVTEAEIQDIVNRLVEGYQPEKIILFGSYAYGNPTEDSDLDLLVVKEDQRPGWERTVEAKSYLKRRKFGLDLLVFTPEEFSALNPKYDLFAFDIQSKGKILYAR
jgi:predicted nucleotidyltransferase